MKRRFGIGPGLCVLAFLTAPPAYAQDTHYWTEQFGNRSYLLAGAVVGDTGDLSAIYYNPGGLVWNDADEFLLAGLGIEFTRVTFRDALADGVDLSKSSGRLVPSLVAGEIPGGGERHRFAYSILRRHGTDVQTSSAVNRSADPSEPSSPVFVSNSLQLESEVSEYWFGGTWAYKLHSNVGVGVTTFLARRSRRAAVGGCSRPWIAATTLPMPIIRIGTSTPTGAYSGNSGSMRSLVRGSLVRRRRHRALG